MFGPGNIHQHFEFVLGRQVQEPARRHVVNAQEIGAQLQDLQKVPRGLLPRRKHFLLLVRREWSVSQTLGVEFLPAAAKESSVHVDA